MKQTVLGALFEEEEPQPLTVSQLNAGARFELERRFRNVWVEGEISGFSPARSGHWYFTLHDDKSRVRAVCYRGSNLRIRFQPFDGLQVRVRGGLTIYEPSGEFQVSVESLQPVGEGARRVAFEQIRNRLASEGLFDTTVKRPIPLFPRRIAVVTSPKGAAFFDIQNVLSRRARSVSILLVPARVQGENAAFEIASAIEFANFYNRGLARDSRIETLIVGRGGGSPDDLWAFNEEIVARAIRASSIPVISAVGHDIDHTIADLAADLRAPTPSAAAEIVAKLEEDICAHIDRRRNELARMLTNRVADAHLRLERLDPANALLARLNERRTTFRTIAAQLSTDRLASKVRSQEGRVLLTNQRSVSAIRKRVVKGSEEVKIAAARLDSLSPLKVLGRGFAVVRNSSGKIVRSTRDINVSELVSTTVANGEFASRVEEVKENTDL